ncbi:unnamed protein product, partial [Dracunculus medinensis]|uniref:UNC80 domain-containing protein n=1 Tax=Dracunculus medinensis TaxID=318479 RepID=A0A0N4UG81_DRAME
TFERVVVQNILHGLSPSLSDAIGSVSRWRFVRAAFPHIVQCCATLLSEAANSKGSSPLSGPLSKILYILHWLLLDSANECCDAESRKSLIDSGEWNAHSVRRYTFSISSIQLFVYLITPLISVINEENISSHIRLESGLKIWQSLWQYRQPEVLCFCAPVKQRRSLIPFITVAKKSPRNSVVQGIYLGDEKETTRRFSTVSAQFANFPQFTLPPAKPPRSDLAVLESLGKKADKHKKLRSINNYKNANSKSKSKAEIFNDNDTKSRVVRSVSEYHDDNLALDIRQKFAKSKTTTFDISPTVTRGMEEIDMALKLVENNSLSDMMADLSEKAPLVQLQEICSNISNDIEIPLQNACDITCGKCKTVIFRKGSLVGTCKCSKDVPISSSKLNIVPTRSSSEQNSSVMSCERSTDETISSIHTVIRRPTIAIENEIIKKEYDPLENLSCGSEIVQQNNTDPQEASYLDIAVIRCLLIKQWSEDGIHWALKYLINRLNDIERYRNTQDGMFRSRANSAPTTPHLKVVQCRTDIRQNLPTTVSRAPNWDDLQLNNVISGFSQFMKNSDPNRR